jgi:asparagine synthase (glutamine-hydrolysing)
VCGIAGYIGVDPFVRDAIPATLESMRQRGPDCQDWVAYESGKLRIFLLHSRLSIIDCEARANQPFSKENVTLIFNGEIYNYLELRKKLESQGAKFNTDSDTEVLLESYLRWGIECFEQLEGMWSFALYDANLGKLILSRDRFGEKPLYFHRTSDGFYFASETRILKKLCAKPFTINRPYLERFLAYGFRALKKTEETFFAEVRSFPAASYQVLEGNLESNPRPFWNPAIAINESMSYEDAVSGFRERLIKSLEIRLRSDVPLAFCLSGGVDSAALASIAKKSFGCDVSTYSIVDRDPRYNEFENISATVADLRCKSTVIELEHAGFKERMENLVRYHDAPVGTISYYVHSMLSEAISRAGFRVVISGTGADELVTGYFDHFLLQLATLTGAQFEQSRANWETHIKPHVRNEHLRDPLLFVKRPEFREHIFPDLSLIRSMLRDDSNLGVWKDEHFDGSILRQRMYNEMFHEVTAFIIGQDDLNSMKCSLENRSPYLDRKLYEFAFSIPDRHLIKDGYAKSVLRDSVEGILNEKVRTDRKKVGFNASIDSLVSFGDQGTRDWLLADSPIFEILDRDRVAPLMDIKEHDNSISKFLFSFISCKIFLEQQSSQ